jgi:hypothetical protein
VRPEQGGGPERPQVCAASQDLGIVISVLNSRGRHELEDAQGSSRAEGSSLIQGVGTL